jgi:hypothetical protein
MRRWPELVARLAMAGLLGAGLMMVPSPQTEVVEARSPACPTPTIQRLVRDGPISCYGSRVLTFRAYVQHPCTDGCGGTSASSISPRWFDSFDGSSVSLGTGRFGGSIPAFVPPALGRCSPWAELRSCPFRRFEGHQVTVRARYNDPRARTCRYSEHPPGAGFTRKDAIAECRANLVVLSIVPAAPETDVVVASAPDRPIGGSTSLPWLVVFSAVLLLGGRWFPHRARFVDDRPRQARRR